MKPAGLLEIIDKTLWFGDAGSDQETGGGAGGGGAGGGGAKDAEILFGLDDDGQDEEGAGWTFGDTEEPD